MGGVGRKGLEGWVGRDRVELPALPLPTNNNLLRFAPLIRRPYQWARSCSRTQERRDTGSIHISITATILTLALHHPHASTLHVTPIPVHRTAPPPSRQFAKGYVIRSSLLNSTVSLGGGLGAWGGSDVGQQSDEGSVRLREVGLAGLALLKLRLLGGGSVLRG